MGNKISLSDNSTRVGLSANYNNSQGNCSAKSITNNPSHPHENQKLKHSPNLKVDLNFIFSRAKCLLCHGHQYEIDGKYQLALNSYVEAVDVLHFISTYCLHRCNSNIAQVRKQTVLAIRKVIFLHLRIGAELSSKKIQRKLTTTVDYDRPTPEEALSYLLQGLPKDEKEVLQNLSQMVSMEVPEVQWSDIVGAESAKRALNDAISHRINYKQAMNNKILVCFNFVHIFHIVSNRHDMKNIIIYLFYILKSNTNLTHYSILHIFCYKYLIFNMATLYYCYSTFYLH